jgi:hypothetical protein
MRSRINLSLLISSISEHANLEAAVLILRFYDSHFSLSGFFNCWICCFALIPHFMLNNPAKLFLFALNKQNINLEFFMAAAAADL